MKLAWGAKISADDRELLLSITRDIGCDPSDLMACIWFESGGNPAAVNAQSGATGIIQFMPGTAIDLGTTTAALADMTFAEQMHYVLAYFRPFAGRLQSLADTYMAILYPKAIGQPDDFTLFAEVDPKTRKAYLQNRGLDIDHDGDVSKIEATSFPARRLAEGLQAGNVWDDGTASPVEAPGQTAGPIPTTAGGSMGAIELVSLITSLFAPKLRAQADKVLGTDVGNPLVNTLLGMAQTLTGKADPLEAVAVARQDPKIVAQMEQTTQDWFAQIAPAIDKIAALERGEWDAEEGSRTAAAARGAQMQAQGPLGGNPQFLIATGILSMVAIVVLSVLWKDAVLAMFMGEAGLKFGFSTDMQAFVIGAIVGGALTAIIGYFYGSTRQSAAKDLTIDAMARQAKK